MSEDRPTTTGSGGTDRRRREQLIRQVIRARRAVDADPAAPTTATGDPAQMALVERAKQWVGEPPHGALPSGPA